MKHKAIYRLAAYIMMAGLAVHSAYPVYAAEIGSEEPPAAEESYVLEADRQQISFGSVEQGSLAASQNIVLTNNGSQEISLSWYESDYYDCIVVDAPDEECLSPGESCTFTVEADTTALPGTYSAFLLFGDVLDPYYEHGVRVDISLMITKPIPALPVVTSVSISPGTVVVSKNTSPTTCAFTALVSGLNDYSREVEWSVSGQFSSDTYIDAGGVLHVAPDETAGALVVKAVSRQDAAYSATALVSLQKNSYYIQVEASLDRGGIVHGSGIVEDGGAVEIYAAPHDGYTFNGWLLHGSVVSYNSRYVVRNVHDNAVYTAEFKPVSCRIQAFVNNSNGGTVSGDGNVDYGGTMTLKAEAKDGYQFDSWMENGRIVSTDSSMQLNNITESREYTAMFSQNRFRLSLACAPADTGILTGQGDYTRGQSAKVTAVPIDGYRFTGWSENGNIVSTDKEYTLHHITKDMWLTAVFEKEEARTYTFTASVSSSNGTITPEGKTVITEGSGILYTISPKSGYMIKAVYVDGKLSGASSSYSFTDIRENHNIMAEFARIPSQEDKQPEHKQPDDKTENDKPDRGQSNDAGTDFGQPEQKEDPAAGPEESKDVSGQVQADIDEQLHAVGMSRLTGTLQYLNIPVDEAERMIDERDDMILLTGALQTGDLQVTIRNDFADNTGQISYSSFYENSGVDNFAAVLDRILTREEKMEMLLGNDPIAVNLHIDDVQQTLQTAEAFERNMEDGMQIGRYFEMFLMKSRQSGVDMITELPMNLRVTIKVPDQLRAQNREFHILRLHANEDGSQEVAVLTDEDTDADTVTFSTDRFSSYAIAYIDGQTPQDEALQSLKELKGRGNGAAVAVIAVIFTLTMTAAVGYLIVKKRR